MRSLRVRLCIAGAGFLALAACSKEPINLSDGFTPPESSLAPASYRKTDAADADTCRVAIGAVLDKRANTDSNGLLGWRVVHYADTAAWMRSGLQSLDRDKRIRIAAGGNPDLVLDVDILKAYVINLTTDKSANVVVRAHYSHNGAPLGDDVIRGVETGWNWANGADETEAAFDDALEDLLKTLDRDIQSRCTALRAAASPAPAPPATPPQ